MRGALILSSAASSPTDCLSELKISQARTGSWCASVVIRSPAISTTGSRYQQLHDLDDSRHDPRRGRAGRPGLRQRTGDRRPGPIPARHRPRHRRRLVEHHPARPPRRHTAGVDPDAGVPWRKFPTFVPMDIAHSQFSRRPIHRPGACKVPQQSAGVVLLARRRLPPTSTHPAR